MGVPRVNEILVEDICRAPPDGVVLRSTTDAEEVDCGISSVVDGRRGIGDTTSGGCDCCWFTLEERIGENGRLASCNVLSRTDALTGCEPGDHGESGARCILRA